MDKQLFGRKNANGVKSEPIGATTCISCYTARVGFGSDPIHFIYLFT